jgi:hypothetical protein
MRTSLAERFAKHVNTNGPVPEHAPELCVRGYLCAACSIGLGALKDSAQRLRGLLVYLESPPAAG